MDAREQLEVEDEDERQKRLGDGLPHDTRIRRCLHVRRSTLHESRSGRG